MGIEVKITQYHCDASRAVVSFKDVFNLSIFLGVFEVEAQIFLQQAVRERLDELKVKNTAFSLRAFARVLGVSPASLSEFLNGKRLLSIKMIKKVADQLCLPPGKMKELNDRILRDINGLEHEPQTDRKKIQLQNDQYYLVSDWHYYAILCLAETPDFKDDYQWIAERLQTSVSKAREAMERLTRLEYLVYNREGKLVCNDIQLFTTEDIPNTSLKIRHSENLDAAKESIFRDEVLVRDFSFATVAINPKKLPEAKRMIREFQDSLIKLLETGEKTQVYEICMQVFPRTSVKTEEIYEH